LSVNIDEEEKIEIYMTKIFLEFFNGFNHFKFNLILVKFEGKSIPPKSFRQIEKFSANRRQCGFFSPQRFRFAQSVQV
jgi:hypothetical protein